jgi:hypothetical protein
MSTISLAGIGEMKVNKLYPWCEKTHIHSQASIVQRGDGCFEDLYMQDFRSTKEWGGSIDLVSLEETDLGDLLRKKLYLDHPYSSNYKSKWGSISCKEPGLYFQWELLSFSSNNQMPHFIHLKQLVPHFLLFVYMHTSFTSLRVL